MKGATMLSTLQTLGVIPWFSRPTVSNDNPYSQWLFKTLKYHPDYPREAFTDITQARNCVTRLVRWYDNEHRHSVNINPEQPVHASAFYAIRNYIDRKVRKWCHRRTIENITNNVCTLVTRPVGDRR